jgi:hypothetical protein
MPKRPALDFIQSYDVVLFLPGLRHADIIFFCFAASWL